MKDYSSLRPPFFLLKVKHPKKSIVALVENMNIIGCVIAVGGIIGISSISLTNMTSCTNSTCQESDPYQKNTTIEINIQIMFIVIGVVMFLLHILFFICLECKIKNNPIDVQVYPSDSHDIV
jgi:hypothetical protein